MTWVFTCCKGLCLMKSASEAVISLGVDSSCLTFKPGFLCAHWVTLVLLINLCLGVIVYTVRRAQTPGSWCSRVEQELVPGKHFTGYLVTANSIQALFVLSTKIT